jgi:radical SAM protein with 4Fe4S-binding SPASM domain
LLKCGVGEGQISISFSGDVYPCALLHNPKLKAGNITENSLAEI